jgi:hypothetical protein
MMTSSLRSNKIDVENLKSRLTDVWSVICSLGFQQGARRTGNNAYTIRCPWHEEKDPSCKVEVYRGILRCTCFGCQVRGDIFSLVAVANRLDLRADFAKVAELTADLAGVTIAAQSPKSATRQQRKPQPTANTEDPLYPPRHEVEELLGPACSVRVNEDGAAMAYLRSRGLDQHAVAVRDLAVALIPSLPLPSWATFGGASWVAAGFRLAFPVFDCVGSVRSVRARRITNEQPKCVPPKGFAVKGLVLADYLAREMLQTGTWPEWNANPPRLIITEGETDFMTQAVNVPANSRGPEFATIGIVAGSWCSSIAKRVPTGAEVFVRTDRDKAGDKYAQTIAQSLSNRCSVNRA